MDEQNIKNPDPLSQPAGEANTAISVPETNKTEIPIVETPKEIQPGTPVEPFPAPEITLEITPTEPIPEILPETLTAQMAGNEPITPPSEEIAPIPEVTEETATLSAGGKVEVPQQATPSTEERPSEETPPKAPRGVLPFSNTDDREENLVAGELPRITQQPQQGTAQPEPAPPQELPMPAQAQVTETPPRNIARLLLEKAKLTIQLRKQKKLLKIMGLFTKKKSITNDDVEKLLHVSDATATRYLSALEKQGKIMQLGKTGHSVTYTKR